MEKDYSRSKYQAARLKINRMRQAGCSWDEVKLDGQNNHDDFLAYIQKEYFGDVDENDWLALVDLAKKNEEKSKDINIGPASIPLIKGGNFTVPSSDQSVWQEYKERLLDKHFLDEDVNNIEKSCITTLNYLKSQNEPHKPTKGMIVGDVQSGKTANMAALMAMACDYGWNMVIILSGTIDNLREQTQNRLIDDLNMKRAAKYFNAIKSLKDERPSSLQLDLGSRQCYFIVCLKNSKRLQDLLVWLNKDKNKKKQMRVLLIDDEADQASINTAKIDKKEKTQINRLISFLVYDFLYSRKSKNKEPVEPDSYFESMNYIGYTATPYANFLNEGPSTLDDRFSLFPEDFIGVLRNSNEYIGPQQIFGSESYPGLSIVNIFGSDTDKLNQALIKGETSSLSDSLKEAIFWFYCCLAIFRFKKKNKKNISMLINISQRTDSHDYIYDAIRSFIHSTSTRDFIESCKKTYKIQTEALTRNDFLDICSNYADGTLEIDDYPSFEEIRPFLEEILNGGIEPVEIDKDSGTRKYIKGVQISIDNGNYNLSSKDEKEFRIDYPEDSEHPDYATGFIVIGGQTLSRGLTLQGLVTTYFARRSRQGDTLMQMGRWFGYRVGYELLPRIWMSKDNSDKFTYLSRIDLHLKKYIEEFSKTNRKPRDYGIKVLNTPYPAWMVLTSKNKMQHAKKVRLDFSDNKYQTTNFFNDKNKLQSNIEATKNFVLEMNNQIGFEKDGSTLIWRNIPFGLVSNFLGGLSFPVDNNAFLDVPQFNQWGKMVTEKKLLTNWNVVFSGLAHSPYGISTELGAPVSRVGRAKKDDFDKGVFRLGAIRDSSDLYVDIPKNVRERAKDYPPSNMSQIDSLRKECDFGSTPELIIYLIAKDSQPDKKKSVKTIPLDSPVDIIGIALNIPAGDIKKDFSEEVSVDLSKYNEEKEEEEEND
ncbi:MAG: Z1 domain-containing protein [Clostridium sp.]|nr:Z1 domain-containing protein [Clostridium sp.]